MSRDRPPDGSREQTGVTRRRLLAASGFAVCGAAAGCGGRRQVGETTERPPVPTQPPTRDAIPSNDRGTAPTTGPGHGTAGGQVPLAEQGVPASICEATPQADPGIYAVTDPAFGPDWDGVAVPDRYRFDDGETPATGLPDDVTVVGLTAGGRARAYPLAVLWWHEVVNDEFGGPVLVTYCPICRSGVVADRTVAGTPTRFLVSGHLWQPPGVRTGGSLAAGRAFGAGVTDPDAGARRSGNLVVSDVATRSLWSQLLAEALCGPLAGTRLDVRASTVTTWGEWRSGHPGTDVLLPPPRSGLARPGDDGRTVGRPGRAGLERPRTDLTSLRR